MARSLRDKWNIEEEETANPRIARYERLIAQFEDNPARATEVLRPQYHFTPVDGFFNDPNGLAFFNGKWRFFYQHQNNWSGAGWGYAVSEDLVHWEYRAPVALPDERGVIWSGSGVVDWNDSSGFFNGEAGYVGVFTYNNLAEGQRQSQALLYSQDGTEFTKYEGNPVIPQLRYLEGHPDEPHFRDPKVFWHHPSKRWVMIVAGGTVRFFSSDNLRDWKFESINDNIVTECPDFFELPVDGDTDNTKWVLNSGGRFYYLGDFDGSVFKPEVRHNLDYGPDFYASQTFSDVPDGRRIMSTWMYRWGNEQWPGRRGGSTTIPVELQLQTTVDGIRLFQIPVEELKILRSDYQQICGKSIDGVLLLGIRGQQLEIIARFRPGDATRFGLNLFVGPNGEKVQVGYDTEASEAFVDRRHAGYNQGNMWNEVYRAPALLDVGEYRSVTFSEALALKRENPDIGVKVLSAENVIVSEVPFSQGQLELRLFLDWASLEAFVNGGQPTITTLVAPQPGSDGIELFADGGVAELISLEAWKMNTIWRQDDNPGGEPQSIRMLPSLDIKKGTEFLLSAKIWPENAENKRVIWRSSNTAVAEVNATNDSEWGRVVAHSTGTVTITATTESGGQMAATTLTIVE